MKKGKFNGQAFYPFGLKKSDPSLSVFEFDMKKSWRVITELS
jgi:hypothetical protein